MITTAFAQRAWRRPSRSVADADQLRAKFSKFATLMDGSEADVLVYLSFPKAHTKQIHSTNPPECLNAQINRPRPTINPLGCPPC